MRQIRSVVRGTRYRGVAACRVFAAMGRAAPLLLSRDRANRHDPSAVRVLSMTGVWLGYVAREDAAVVAPRLDAGEIWLCRVRTRAPKILLWTDGQHTDAEQNAELWARTRKKIVVSGGRLRVVQQTTPEHPNCRCVLMPGEHAIEDNGVIYVWRNNGWRKIA